MDMSGPEAGGCGPHTRKLGLQSLRRVISTRYILIAWITLLAAAVDGKTVQHLSIRAAIDTLRTLLYIAGACNPLLHPASLLQLPTRATASCPASTAWWRRRWGWTPPRPSTGGCKGHGLLLGSAPVFVLRFRCGR